MKVYISSKKPETDQYQHISNIMTLDNSVLDCEANDIIVNNYLSDFSDGEHELLISKILSKLRLNGTITIIDNDFDILANRYSRNEIDIKTMNQFVFDGGTKKSLLKIESVIELLNGKCKIEQSSITSQDGGFMIKARRV